MKGIHHFKWLSILLVLAYLLSACSGAAIQSSNEPTGGGKALPKEIAFTGTVEAIDSHQIIVSGQTVSIDPSTLVDPGIKVGDTVKIEAQVSASGTVLALKVETFGADVVTATTSSAETSTPEIAQTPEITGTPATSLNQTSVSSDKEVTGVVNALTDTTITIDGVEYQLSSLTEFNGTLAVGDTVKLHLVVNADGSLSVSEIEKTTGTVSADNSNNGNDDNSGDDSSDDEHDDNGGGG